MLRHCYANSTVYPSESALSSKWHVWFASRCPGDSCLVFDSTPRSLRSADVPTCVVLPTLSSYGDRTFAVAGPRLWNSLPVLLRNPEISPTDLFSGSMKMALCDLIYGVLEKHLFTYLPYRFFQAQNAPKPVSGRVSAPDPNWLCLRRLPDHEVGYGGGAPLTILTSSTPSASPSW